MSALETGLVIVVTSVVVAGFGWMIRSRSRPALKPVLPPIAPPRTQAALPLHQTLSTESGQTAQVLKQLGQGGMAVVYEGLITSMSPPLSVAIKEMQTQQETGSLGRKRFGRELVVCRGLEHAGIVKVLDWGLKQVPRVGPRASTQQEPADQVPFLVMELVQGQTLRQKLESAGGPLPVTLVVGWLREALLALKVAHDAGVIHRDLKPENLMVTDAGRLKIMDFGLAHILTSEELTKTNTTMGTPQYMSLEHLDARTVVPASDIYSLGVTVYELLAGRPPFQHPDPMMLIVKMMNEEPPAVSSLNPAIPQPLSDLVMAMVARELTRRPASCEHVLSTLQALLDNGTW